MSVSSVTPPDVASRRCVLSEPRLHPVWWARRSGTESIEPWIAHRQPLPAPAREVRDHDCLAEMRLRFVDAPPPAKAVDLAIVATPDLSTKHRACLCMGRRRPRVSMVRPLDNLRDPMHGRIEDVLVGGRGVCVDSGLRATVLMVPILTPLRSPIETEYRFWNLSTTLSRPRLEGYSSASRRYPEKPATEDRNRTAPPCHDRACRTRQNRAPGTRADPASVTSYTRMAWVQDHPLSERGIEQRDHALLRRYRELRRGADAVTAAWRVHPEVIAVSLIGSVARAPWKEVPRFAPYRRARVALWHECKDVDLVLWLESREACDSSSSRSRPRNEYPANKGNRSDQVGSSTISVPLAPVRTTLSGRPKRG